MGVRRRARVLAFQALYAWDVGAASNEELLGFSWYEGPAEETAAKREECLTFARLLTAGTIENIERVDEEIQLHLTHWGFDRVGRIDLAVLRMSAYSLLFVSGIPHTITIDEAIDIARSFGGSESYRFVNGVLDGIRKALPESAV